MKISIILISCIILLSLIVIQGFGQSPRNQRPEPTYKNKDKTVDKQKKNPIKKPEKVNKSSTEKGSVAGTVSLFSAKKNDLSNVVFWLEPTSKKKSLIEQNKTVTVHTKGKKFLPRVIAISVGDTVSFPNEDPFSHNVFSNSKTKRFDLGLYQSGDTRTVQFNEPGVVPIYCNIHPQQKCFVIVVKTPFYTVTADDGKFQIDGIPAGNYKFQVWSERAASENLTKLERNITVKAGVMDLGSVQIDESIPPRNEPRRNEAGKDYSPGGFVSETTSRPVELILGGFVKISPGEFMMGSEKIDNEGPMHKVAIIREFEMGETEVTQRQWQTVMGNNPSYYKGQDFPVTRVSWEDVQVFIKIVNENSDKYRYRLPTEAEWEYAARAGNKEDSAENLDEMAWYGNNATGKPHEVRQKKANAWGLYDMYGNMWEWCSDWYGNYPSGTVTDPSGASSGTSRVSRGGSFDDFAAACQSVHRGNFSPSNQYNYVGFRLVRVKRSIP